jgi:hypothetical protein
MWKKWTDAWPVWAVAAAALVVLAACGEPAGGVAGGAAVGELGGEPVELVNRRLPDAVAGQPEWAHQQTVEVDLDGDGTPDRAVLTANVTMFRGRLDWQDSQQWQVYVEEADGTRTYVYKQVLQLGTLRARLARPQPGQTPTIVLLEQLPQRISVYEIRYLGRGQAQAVQLVRREFDLRHMFEGTPEP